jgi:uncharacterized membrane protein
MAAAEEENDRLARAVSWTLLTGLSISVVLILLGAVLTVSKEPPESPHDTGVLTLPARAARGDGTAVLELGLFVLMLTPVARVLVLAIGWLTNRDWTFGLVACCVLALLGLSILLGTG